MSCIEISLVTEMILVIFTLNARRNQSILSIRRWMAVLIISNLPRATDGGAPSNSGKEFMIGFMENYVTYRKLDVEVFVTTMRTIPVKVDVTAPRYSSTINVQFSVKAGEVKQLFFPYGIRPKGSVKVPYAVHVKADEDVVVYAVNKAMDSADAYLGIPVDVLGTEYYAVTYYPPFRQCELMIVGVEDGTAVTIKFPANMQEPVFWNSQLYGAGSTLTGTVDRFDTWQLVSKGDLTGAYITSDKKVGVISGNKRTTIMIQHSSDHLCEMMVPVSRWGKNFISVPIPERTVGDIFRFIASEAGTTITISGGYTKTFTLTNAGDFVEKHIDSTAYCSIKADKAIMVVQFVLSQNSVAEPSDPAMMLLPPIEQYAADYTFTTPKYSQPPATYDSFFMFVIREDDKDGLKVDGTAFPSSTVYHQVVHNGVNYAAGYIEVSEGTHSVRHDSPIKVFGGYLYGKAKFETYAFSTGTRLAPINEPCTPTTTEIGDGLDNDCDGLIDEEACWDSNPDDDGDLRQDEDCATPPPVNGNWADWNQWGACSVTCFSTTGASNSGSRSRDRTCTNPAPAYDGKQCVGQASEIEACSVPNVYCPVNGQWADWNQWGACSVTCFSITGASNSGSRSRDRTCTNPAPAYDGKQCVGQASETEACSVSNVYCPATNNRKSCKEILDLYPATKGKDGIYDVYFGCQKKEVFCDMTTDGGGWTIIQKRHGRSVDFSKSWYDYKKGFGSAKSGYWIGNDVINALTSEMNHELRVELKRFEYARYSSFHVGDEISGYAITVSGYSGSAGDILRHNNGMKFSTYDKDNDEVADGNCAKERHGAWWYKNCNDLSLNGKYKNSPVQVWRACKQKAVPLERSVMMIRPNSRG